MEASGGFAAHLAAHRGPSLSWRHGVGADGARALVDSGILATLEQLDLSFGKLGDEGAEVLASVPAAPQLRVLSLTGCGLSVRGLSAIAASPAFAAVEALDISHNWSRGVGLARAIAAAPFALRLRKLALEGCGFSNDDSAALAGVTLVSLRELNLGHAVSTSTTDAHLAAIAAAPLLAPVEVLWVYQTPAGDIFARALAASPHVARLHTLSLGSTHITAAGVAVIANAPTLAGLRKIYLDRSYALPYEEWTDWNGAVVGGETDATAYAAMKALLGDRLG